MTDQQLAALLSILGGGGLIGAIKWAVGRVTRALDANTAAHLEAARESAAHAEVLRQVAEAVEAVREWCEAHTGVTSLPDGLRRKKERAATPGRGQPIGSYSFKRPKTNVEDE